jgi:hypothetical protein
MAYDDHNKPLRTNGVISYAIAGTLQTEFHQWVDSIRLYAHDRDSDRLELSFLRVRE